MIVHKARYKSGRAWIAKILDCTTSVVKVEIDGVTDERTQTTISTELLRKFVEIDGRDVTFYEISDNEFVYLTSGVSGRFITKYVLRTYPFDPTGLPGTKES